MKEYTHQQAVDNLQSIRENDVAIEEITQEISAIRSSAHNLSNNKHTSSDSHSAISFFSKGSSIASFFASFFSSSQGTQKNSIQQLTHESEQLLTQQEDRLKEIELAQAQLLQDQDIKIRELQNSIKFEKERRASMLNELSITTPSPK